MKPEQLNQYLWKEAEKEFEEAQTLADNYDAIIEGKQQYEKTKLDEQLAELQEKVMDLDGELYMINDSYSNFKNKIDKENQKNKNFVLSKFTKDVLEVQDNLLRSLEAFQKHEDINNEVYQDVKDTAQQLVQNLAFFGILQINPAQGEKFDPNLHDALCNVPDNTQESGTVAFVGQIGYKINERIIRPAKVGVYSKQ
ncbi:hypothetical protein IMG5_081820 [Ichthyophthirius multifiliis]|uniref:GrpE protein homolog n=1 Tax=Ichthyophthirius multifiliis TaxID=5932 RepID=G0QQN5_ICHMU|nr:hypothetical protein IMG5_081820 [Ichthyophthirius multifiliis]EGR32467.1 hypothetical protein IMG5_081820 [Ichthyophthirius multifiliis]|eukprot:XP_004036453.1 hypothetical protein IMG5_081820 [Ichthyophthirius multifiliis]